MQLEAELLAHVAAAASVLTYLEVRVTKAVHRQSYLLEQRHRDRRRRQKRHPGYGRRADDRQLPERATLDSDLEDWRFPR